MNNAAACNWPVICRDLNAATLGEGSSDTYIDWLNMAVMVALGDTLLTELLISQNTTAEHVALMKQIVWGRGGVLRGISVERQHEAEYLNSTFSFSTSIQNISICQPVNQVTRQPPNQSNNAMKHSSF